MKYLLDTNICIYFLKGLFNLDTKFSSVKEENIYISEITLAELKFGAENSGNPTGNRKTIETFASRIQILPIFGSLDVYAKEKARLRKKGKPVDDFDLLIGATAVANSLILVTNNEKHFRELKGIRIENWVTI